MSDTPRPPLTDDELTAIRQRDLSALTLMLMCSPANFVEVHEKVQESQKDVTPLRYEVDRLRAERDRFREHSVTLNTVGWTLAVALGDAPAEAESVLGNPVEQAERIVAELAAARRDAEQAQAERYLLGRQQQALLDLCHNIERVGGASVVLGLVFEKLITDPADAAPQADEPLPTITESEAERLANLRDCLGTRRGGLHCLHYREGDGDCCDCGRANPFPDGGVVPGRDPLPAAEPDPAGEQSCDKPSNKTTPEATPATDAHRPEFGTCVHCHAAIRRAPGQQWQHPAGWAAKHAAVPGGSEVTP